MLSPETGRSWAIRACCSNSRKLHGVAGDEEGEDHRNYLSETGSSTICFAQIYSILTIIELSQSVHGLIQHDPFSRILKIKKITFLDLVYWASVSNQLFFPFCVFIVLL